MITDFQDKVDIAGNGFYQVSETDNTFKELEDLAELKTLMAF